MRNVFLIMSNPNLHSESECTVHAVEAIDWPLAYWFGSVATVVGKL